MIFSILSKKHLITLPLLIGLFWSQCSVAAMICKAGSGDNSRVVELNKPIKVSTLNMEPGTLIWTSNRTTVSIVCSESTPTTGSKVKPEGEMAYLFINPNDLVQGIDKSLELVVFISGVEYKITPGASIPLGVALVCNPGSFCVANSRFTDRRGYRPAALAIDLSVGVRLTGAPPPESGKIASVGSYRIFSVAGDANQRSDTSGSFNLNNNFSMFFNGLSNISFISCKPTINIIGNTGSTVGFGLISVKDAVVGKIQKEVPFSVSVDMSSGDNGQACQGGTMQATFSTNYPVLDQTTILPSNESGFGILISQAEAPGTPIVMNQTVDLGLVNGTVIQNRFLAGLKWLSTTPRVGPFTASATVNITFK